MNEMADFLLGSGWPAFVCFCAAIGIIWVFITEYF